MGELLVAGGALDGSGDPVNGYVTRGGRMLTEKACVCLWNVLARIPSLDDSIQSAKDQVWAFNDEWRGNTSARLIDTDHRILRCDEYCFSVIWPMEKWLAGEGVVFAFGTKATDVDFIEQGDTRRIGTLLCTREGKSFTHSLGRDDYAFVTKTLRPPQSFRWECGRKQMGVVYDDDAH